MSSPPASVASHARPSHATRPGQKKKIRPSLAGLHGRPSSRTSHTHLPRVRAPGLHLYVVEPRGPHMCTLEAGRRPWTNRGTSQPCVVHPPAACLGSTSAPWGVLQVLPSPRHAPQNPDQQQLWPPSCVKSLPVPRPV